VFSYLLDVLHVHKLYQLLTSEVLKNTRFSDSVNFETDREITITLQSEHWWTISFLTNYFT